MRVSFVRRRSSSLALGLFTVLGALGISVAAPTGSPTAGAATSPPPTLSVPTITAPASPTPPAISTISTVTVSGTASATTPTVAVVVTVRTSPTATSGDWTALAKITSGTWSVPISLLKGTYYLRALEIDTEGDAGQPSTPPVALDVTSDSAVVNGGFETPPALHGTIFASIPGWTPTVTTCPPAGPHYAPRVDLPTVHNAAPVAAGKDGIEIQSNTIYGVAAETGDQYLTMAANCVGGVEQHVATIPGLQYTLTFYYRARPGITADENVLTVQWGGTHISQRLQGQTTATVVVPGAPYIYTKSASNTTYKSQWTKATYTVTATSYTTVLRFNDSYTLTPAVTVGPFLDDVSLVPTYSRAPPNTRWQTATTIDPKITGSLTFTGEQLWYKFPVTPGEHISAKLSDVPANYQLWVFSDITTLYSSLTNATTALTITQLEAENPANSDQSASLANGKYYNGKYYNGDFADGKYYNGKYYNGEFADGKYYNGKYYNGKYYNGKYYNGGHGLTGIDSAALGDSLVGFSTQQGAVTKTVTAETYNDTGDFYVEVSGNTGAFAPSKLFTLTVTITGSACPLTVTKTFFSSDKFATTTSTATPVADTSHTAYTTLIVDDSQQMPQAGSTYTGPTPVNPALTALAKAAPAGHIVDVGTSTWVRTQTTQAKANASCPYAVNLEADAIQRIINTYRVTPTNLKNVIIVGDDDVIPFFRDPDQEQVEPETQYTIALTSNSEGAAAIAKNYFLTDDQYGSAVSLTINGSTLPVQTAAVGRLVETPSDIVNTITNYLTAVTPHKVVKAASTLSAGYTFMARGAQQIATQLKAEGVATNATLITGENVSPSTPASWSATQLMSALKTTAHQLVFIGAHFNANQLLAANRKTTLTTHTFASQIGTSLENSVVLSAGCHAGYTVDPAKALTYTTQLAWPQAFVEAGAALVAGTGFQYGDSNYVAASNQFYSDLVQQFGYTTHTATPSLGTALLQTQWRFLAGLDELNGLEQKSLLQITLYGIPMLGVKMATTHQTPGVASSLVPSATPVSGNTFTLSEATLSLSGTQKGGQLAATPVTVTVTGTNMSYDQGNFGVLADPGSAVVPVEIDNVNVASHALRGVGFWGGTYTDTTVPLPLTGDPVTQTSAPTQPFSSSEYYPQRISNPNYFGALHTGADTELGVTPVQYVSKGASTATMRQFSKLNFKLFYTPAGTTAAANGAALAAPPSITETVVTVQTTTVTVTATVAPDAAGIQEVWTTYTDPGPASSWTSRDLSETPYDPARWSTTFTLTSPSAYDFMVQAANGEGDVSLADNQGAFYTPTQVSGSQTKPTTPAASSLALAAGNPTSGTYGSSVQLGATLTTSGSSGDRPIWFSIGSSSVLAYTDTSGLATATVPLGKLAPRQYTATASFTGTLTVEAASASAAFTVVAAATTLTLSAPTTITSGSSSGVSATLEAGGAPLAQHAVHFDVTSPTGTVVASSSVTTSKTGVAQAGALTLPAGDVGGNYTVTAYFSTPATPVVGSTTASPKTEATTVVGYAPAQPSGAEVTVHDSTQTTLSASPNPATFGQTVTLIATVDPAGTSTTTWPSGTSPAGRTVTFYNGTNAVGSQTLTLTTGVAEAKFALHGLSGGTHTLKVRFPGATDLGASTGRASEPVGFTETISTTESKPLTVAKGQVVLVTGTVSAPITVKAGGGLEVDGGTVDGPISASGAIAFALCGATVSGPVSVTGSTGFVFIGGGSGTGCARTKISGPVSLSKNTAGVEVANSTVSGPVSVTGNHGASPVLINGDPAGPEIAGNTISGPLSCSGNTPAPTDDTQPNTVSGPRGGQCDSPKDF
jgi:hypothetical protein